MVIPIIVSRVTELRERFVVHEGQQAGCHSRIAAAARHADHEHARRIGSSCPGSRAMGGTRWRNATGPFFRCPRFPNTVAEVASDQGNGFVVQVFAPDGGSLATA
jgi:hypothetical protein